VLFCQQVDSSDYVRLVLARHAKSDASKKLPDSKAQKVCAILTLYITTHSQTFIFCIVSRVDKRYL